MKNLLNRKVHLVDDVYTVKELIIVGLSIIAFVLLLGYLEGLGHMIEG